MERSRRAVSGLRRYTWSEHNFILETQENVTFDLSMLQHQLHIMNAQTWQAGVLSITYPNGSTPIAEPLPYAKCLTHIKSVKGWIMCGEYNPEGIFHIHIMALTLQRSDSFRRSLEREWFVHRFEIFNSIDNKDPTLDVLKMQKCHKPESLIAYMCKDPLWLAASDNHYMNILSSVYVYDLGERFRIKQQEKKNRELAENTAVNKIVSDILNVIYDHNCKSIEDCMKAAPDIMSLYLHRSGFASIVQNCLTFVTATSHTWSLTRIAMKNDPNPTMIHACILHQGIDIDIFDAAFFKWITKTMSKHNTFVLWGCSNTGKSAFISGLKQCLSWGEIVNTNNFAFEGLIGNTIGVWEEPLISPELAEKAKQIFEGMECSIPVKFKKPVKLPRIPIIMTTNHAPWRFCTHEEPMFRNRMFIFNWNFDMANTPLTYRNRSESCECDSCKGSRGCETIDDSEPAGGMQREQQPIQLDGSANKGSNVWSRSLHNSSKDSLGGSTGSRQISGCDDGRYSCGSGSSDKQCSDSSGSSVSTSTTASDRIRTCGTNRPSDSIDRISGTKPRDDLSLVSYIRRLHDRDDSRRDRVGNNGDRDPGEGTSYSGGINSKYDSEQEMVVLGKRSKTSETSVQTKKQRLDRKVVSLNVPTKTDWLGYLSYLQKQYG
uniref:NS1 n=1 Tax=Feline chaphamaparvovirus TaxID=2736647 RepID=A0A894KN44_9VIRU|nr:NS1 [Feline chaphamaparvovirus]